MKCTLPISIIVSAVSMNCCSRQTLLIASNITQLQSLRLMRGKLSPDSACSVRDFGAT